MFTCLMLFVLNNSLYGFDSALFVQILHHLSHNFTGHVKVKNLAFDT